MEEIPMANKRDEVIADLATRRQFSDEEKQGWAKRRLKPGIKATEAAHRQSVDSRYTAGTASSSVRICPAPEMWMDRNSPQFLRNLPSHKPSS